MHSLLANHILKVWLFLSVICYYTHARPNDDKKMNLKIGFDLTQGENGAHSLRIRDFEDSVEFNPRAVAEVGEEKKSNVAVRADSFSDSSDTATNDQPAARYVSRESKERDNISAAKSDNDSNESERKSTKGLSPDAYEPEENPSVHPKYQSSESDSDRPLRRRKRDIHLKGLLDSIKRKSREFFNTGRKSGVSTTNH